MVDAIDVRSLFTLPEGETIDFKAGAYDLSTRDRKARFAKDLACLANTPREGNAYIVLGVDKLLDGTFTVLGIEPNIDDAILQSIAASFLDPSPRFLYQTAPADDVHVGLIIIPEDQPLPALPRRSHGRDFLREGRLYFRRGSQNALASVHDQRRIWAWFLRRDHPSGRSPGSQSGHPPEVWAGSRRSEPMGSGGAPSESTVDADSLLRGPIEALGLNPVVEQAERIRDTSPSDAASLYGVVSNALRDRFPGFADRYDQSRATALKRAGDHGTSHDVLMDLALRDLFAKAEPHPAQGVAHELRELDGVVDEVRRARGGALTAFARWHEAPDALQALAEHFDELGADDPYAPHVAVLLAEAALADREFQVVLDREGSLRRAVEHGRWDAALRVRIALADAGTPEGWPTLLDALDSGRFSAEERTYICLRAGRWYAWHGDLTASERLYRQAVELGASAALDLDVENALWSLTRLYAFPERADELLRTNQLALSVHGSRSYVPVNSRTRERTYRYLANEKLPDAHLWSRYRLLESVRSGCLMDELEAHAVLARVYQQAEEQFAALDHAVLSGSDALVKAIAPELGTWTAFIADAARNPAPWVRPVALAALEQVGDFAPRDASRSLAHALIDQLEADGDDSWIAPALFCALWSIVLEATDDDLDRLMRMLTHVAPREPGRYLLTDPGVGLLAGRLYRFRPALRSRAASVLAEMSVGGHTNDWRRALHECGEEIDELIAAFERVSAREAVDLAGPFSDLGHLNAATRTLWASRLRYVEQHPLGERSEYSLLSRYDVPKQFLEEQAGTIAERYVQKLVAIGSDRHEAIVNRVNALRCAAAGVEILGADRRRELFVSARSLTDPETKVSELDEFEAGTSHPLSRFQISLGNAADIRAAALSFLARSAVEPKEVSTVAETALSWLASESEVLQRTGAGVLTLPHLSSLDIPSADLAGHRNPLVRRAAVALPSMQQRPDLETLGRLASDPSQPVRIGVVYALKEIREVTSEAYEEISARLRTDQSAIVRAITSEVLGPASQGATLEAPTRHETDVEPTGQTK